MMGRKEQDTPTAATWEGGRVAPTGCVGVSDKGQRRKRAWKPV